MKDEQMMKLALSISRIGNRGFSSQADKEDCILMREVLTEFSTKALLVVRLPMSVSHEVMQAFTKQAKKQFLDYNVAVVRDNSVDRIEFELLSTKEGSNNVKFQEILDVIMQNIDLYHENLVSNAVKKETGISTNKEERVV